MIKVIDNRTTCIIDQELNEKLPYAKMVLMEDAAFAVADTVMSLPFKGRIIILIGDGDIGSIGIATLRLLVLHGMDAFGLLCKPIADTESLFRFEYDFACKLQLPFTDDCGIIESADIIIDAILDGRVIDSFDNYLCEIIEYVNRGSAYRIAVDVPSGMDGDTGKTATNVINADKTIALHCIKRGLLLTDNREAVGKIDVRSIVPTNASALFSMPDEELIDEKFVRSMLPDRKLVSNKGTYGCSLIIAGSDGMSGAAVMAASSALRTGSGLVNAYVPKSVVRTFDIRPEIMVHEDNGEIGSFLNLITKADAIGIGCGSGRDHNITQKLMLALNSGKPCVIDADGINNLGVQHITKLHRNCVLTPHPGEMARLLGVDIADVLKNRVEIARNYALEHGCVLLLKSSVTVIASPSGGIRYNMSGNPGLAKGGSGDVLTGIITALLAQGLKPFDAASIGAFLLGASADKVLEMLNNRLLTACDVADAVSLIIGSNGLKH